MISKNTRIDSVIYLHCYLLKGTLINDDKDMELIIINLFQAVTVPHPERSCKSKYDNNIKLWHARKNLYRFLNWKF